MEIVKGSQLIRSLSYSVPSRAALAGNPSDLAQGAGIGAVLAMPLWGLQATVSFLPSDRFYIRGPAATHESFKGFVEATCREGVDDAERLFRGTSLAFAKLLQGQFGRDPSAASFRVAWDTTIPRQRGLSGSSALILAYLKGLLEIHELDDHPVSATPLLGTVVTEIENEVLGIVAGLQDRVLQVYAAADPGLGALYMDFSAAAFAAHEGKYGDYRPIKTEGGLPDLALMLAAEPSHSGRMHSEVKEKIRLREPEIIRQMNDLAWGAECAAEAFSGGDWQALGLCMKENAWTRVRIYGEKVLGETNMEMLKLCQWAKCPANFTGSGGAMIVLLSEGEESFGRLKNEIREAGSNFELLRL